MTELFLYIKKIEKEIITRKKFFVKFEQKRPQQNRSHHKVMYPFYLPMHNNSEGIFIQTIFHLLFDCSTSIFHLWCRFEVWPMCCCRVSLQFASPTPSCGKGWVANQLIIFIFVKFQVVYLF